MFQTPQSGTKPKPFRHLRPTRKPTTLIIGFRCTQGTVLVSDTKITDTEGGEPTYAPKISIPLQGTPFVIGAAGFTDLFHEFNRKIPIAVGQRLREYQVKNVEALTNSGMEHEEAISYVLSESLRLSQAPQPPPIESAKAAEKPSVGLPLPYVYSAENFLDDCRGLMRGISEQVETDSPFPLEALAIIYRADLKNALLHYIDWDGSESTVEFYRPIGSGSPYVRMFFDRLYRFDRPLTELVSLAIFTISFTQRIAKESGVGYNDANPPQVCLVVPDGRFGSLTIKNMKEILSDSDRQLKEFETLIQSYTPSEVKV